MKGFVWRLVVALSVFTEIVTAQYDVPEANERNVARLGTCSNSSVSRRDNSDRHCSWIINGNKDVTDGSRNCFSTADEVTKPSRLTVILKHRYYIHKVVIYGRSNDLDRMPQIQVFFDGVPVYNVSEKSNVTIWKIPENSRRYAKNVLLHKDNTTTYRDISLCEVEIYTCNEGFFGPRCDRPCGARRCKECNGACLVNVAPLGTCSNSSMSEHSDFAGSTCNLYINGNTTTFFSKQVNCFETGNQKNPESVSVTLRHKYAIHSVVLYSRADWQNRMRGVEVHLDGFSVYKVSDADEETIIYVNNLNLREASTVTLVRRNESTRYDRPMINLCELEIYTCGKGFFGPSCDQPCDDICAECKEKEKCLECEEGFWGTNLCPNKCGQGCESGNCSIADGTCQCRKTQGQHWEPPKCEICIEKYWGDNCSETCPTNCQGPCKKTDGQCEVCIEKYWGDNCSETCPTNCQGPCKKTDGQCEGCSKDYWGANCTHECSKTCTGRDQEGYCDSTTGQCLKGCSAGYWGDNCSATCGKGCENTCNAKDGTCDCRQGWKPPKCEGCSEKYWGDTCDNTCPPNCQECKKTDGQCEVCIEKYWGDNCSETCPTNCQGPCKKTDGQCEVCIEKYWGDTCNKTCPLNCQGPCKKTDGQCEVTPPPTSPPPSEKKFPIWAAALIALGILGLIALLVCLVFQECRKRRKDQNPAQAPEGGPKENPEGEPEGEEEEPEGEGEEPEGEGEEPEGEDEKSSQTEHIESAEVAEESEQPEEAAEGGEAAPAE